MACRGLLKSKLRKWASKSRSYSVETQWSLRGFSISSTGFLGDRRMEERSHALNDLVIKYMLCIFVYLLSKKFELTINQRSTENEEREYVYGMVTIKILMPNKFKVHIME